MPADNQSPTGVPAIDDFGLEPAITEQTPPADTAPTIPEKYRNKSVEELIEMHQNAERRLSQQGNELGEMRRIADGLIGLKKTDNTKTAPERKPVTVETLLNNPEQALTDTIERSTVAEKTDATARRVENLEASLAQRAFEGKYADYQADMANPAFIEWVKKNSLRTKLAAAAYQGNYDAASELWGLWDEVKAVVSGTQPQPANKDTKKTVQDAKVVRQGATGDGTPKRIYSRAKLMALRERVADGDPTAQAQWNNQEFQTALIQAYDEGRVR